MTPQILQLFSLPLEILGVLLAMLEVFSPSRAERVTLKIVDTANDMRGFVGGVLVIVTLGLIEAKPWQRVLVIGGLGGVFAFLAWRGNPNSFYLGAILWPAITLLIVATYAVIFGIFKLVRHFFPTRVLGIIGVLTASMGLLVESIQYIAAISTLDLKTGTEGIDFVGMILIIFYGTMILCFGSLFWIVFLKEDDKKVKEE